MIHNTERLDMSEFGDGKIVKEAKYVSKQVDPDHQSTHEAYFSLNTLKDDIDIIQFGY